MGVFPTITIRQMMIAMAVLGVFSSICAMAARGNTVALGAAVAIAGLVIPFGVFAITYWLLLAVARLTPVARKHDPQQPKIDGFEP